MTGICEAGNGALDDPEIEIEIDGNNDADAETVCVSVAKTEAGTLPACAADAATLTNGASENGGMGVGVVDIIGVVAELCDGLIADTVGETVELEVGACDASVLETKMASLDALGVELVTEKTEDTDGTGLAVMNRGGSKGGIGLSSGNGEMVASDETVAAASSGTLATRGPLCRFKSNWVMLGEGETVIDVMGNCEEVTAACALATAAAGAEAEAKTGIGVSDVLPEREVLGDAEGNAVHGPSRRNCSQAGCPMSEQDRVAKNIEW